MAPSQDSITLHDAAEGRALGLAVDVVGCSEKGSGEEVVEKLLQLASGCRERWGLRCLPVSMADSCCYFLLIMPRPVLVLAGGETTVVVNGTGKGGRNQVSSSLSLRGLSHGCKRWA